MNKKNSIPPFAAYDKRGYEVHQFNTVQEAIKLLGGSASSYTNVLSGKRKTLFNFTFKYIKDEQKNNKEGLELS